ncbi:hypothetical protein [Bradyrhizobium sp.]|uniref:hypothetical protein n=1 Tax=Bradyrhizobium sp. TaxID=376 RepID=UPI0025C4ACE7|nr:hypothetical protein [Bradyrhizobium sp.]
MPDTDVVRLQFEDPAEFDQCLMAPSRIRHRHRKVRQHQHVFRRDRAGDRKTPGGIIGPSDTVKQRPLFDQRIQVPGIEFEYFVQVADRVFQVAPFCRDPRKQQKNAGPAVAMVEDSQIILFCLLEISAAMMSRGVLQELKQVLRRIVVVLIGRHVPAFTPEGCGAKRLPKGHCLEIRIRVEASKAAATAWKKTKPAIIGLPGAHRSSKSCGRTAPRNQRGSNDSPARAHNHAKTGVGSRLFTAAADQSSGYRRCRARL